LEGYARFYEALKGVEVERVRNFGKLAGGFGVAVSTANIGT
jgi:fructose-1-phosphate kinase PfkB-like protein